MFVTLPIAIVTLTSFTGLLTDEAEAENASTLNVVKETMRRHLFTDMKSFKNSSCDRYSTRKIHMAEIVKHNSLLSEYDAARASRGSASAAESESDGASSQANMVPSAVLQRHLSHRNDFQSMNDVNPMIDQTMLTYYRKMFLENIRRKYWNFIEEGRLPRGERGTTTLLYSVDTALRRVGFQGKRDWEFIEKRMTPDARLKTFVSAISDYVPSWYGANRHSFLRCSVCIIILMSVMCACYCRTY
jgi:hypothetical protein